ncbi:xanthine dehydrogenase family protein molybdopterin-binding subunit [Roseomonas populi]|uniref:Xanthine dehydrogenase family protein molybdopterin-binding subunit n=1 Tax=Roseomonas populi TaxID=3121582 RepID=A0ABT1X5P4_9PROT|nr:xanthine dehydrogenase family protein molybdopterin-binding subunit [Roseomonas pecuniae]MCR0982713.1 xanthine dehydrogenase family protein molybdopterin-binding subunit [Roseomonas pecuniae]
MNAQSPHQPGAGRLVGRDVPRVEDSALIRGRGRYVDDIAPPGLLHAAFLRSPHAHAAIRGIDTAAARALPGVHAVLTLAELAPHLTDTRLVVALPSPAYRLELHRPVLADAEVTHVGEAVAVVIADTRAIAEDAAALVEVDYDPLPAVADCVAALEPGAPLAHSGAASNLAAELTLEYGAVDAAFATAPHRFAERLSIHRGGSHSMECRGVLARHDPLDDRLTVWSSTQTPHTARRMLCDLLGLPEEGVRVVTPDVGGGFGPKLIFYPEEVVVALAARLLTRPVKWIEDRAEHFVATTQERDQLWDVELATDGEGRILAVRGQMIHDHGAYTARGVNVPQGAVSAMPLAYVVPAFRVAMKVAATNKVPVTPVRGAGQPQGVFAMERLLDRAARELNLDRAEIRRRNLVPGDRMPYATPLKTRGGMQVVLDSGDYPRCMAMALEAAGWDAFPERQRAALAEGRHIGIGVANYVEGTGRGPFEHVSVRIEPSGRIVVATGAAAMGQSTHTMLAQLVAEHLGGDMSRVHVIAGDTAAAPMGIGGSNSRQAVLAGSSAHVAALRVKDKVLHVAAGLLEADEGDLEIEGDAVRVKGVPEMKVMLAEIARAVAGAPGFAIPGGRGPGLIAAEEVVIDAMAYANGTAVAEVEVDAETGEARILALTFSHDCGNALHPRIVDGQLMGGIAHGIGNALFEHMRYDEEAQPTSTTLADYLLVTATEMPPVRILHMQSPTPLNPLGIKGVGEAGVIPVPAAIAAAIEDALSPFGAHVTRVPLSPVDIVALIDPAAAA